jgi:hypothetical protein
MASTAGIAKRMKIRRTAICWVGRRIVSNRNVWLKLMMPRHSDMLSPDRLGDGFGLRDVHQSDPRRTQRAAGGCHPADWEIATSISPSPMYRLLRWNPDPELRGSSNVSSF